MSERLAANPGSFRDPANRVYEAKPDTEHPGQARVLRGMNQHALEIYKKLSSEVFFRNLVDDGRVVATELVDTPDADADTVRADGWAGVLEHQMIPFVTYPYEWTFSMLKDAALLQLRIIEISLENGWALKDATPYNIQWIGPRPVFIDVPSFEPRVEGESWTGYRQFCSMFLTPLVIRAHLGIDQLPILRSCIDGVPPTEAVKYFTGLNRLKRGVLSHIVFPAKVESAIARRERDDAPAKRRAAGHQSKAMVVGLVQSMARLIRKLSIKTEHTDWSRYDKTHSYRETDFDIKKDFVLSHVANKKRSHIWDIGCNTGTFAKLVSEFCNQVIAVDGDYNAIEQLYESEKNNPDSNILPLIANLSNLSPNQGWASGERQSFDRRKKPDLVLCLALIHHLRISANIPNVLFLKWLRSLDACIILEFVNREDEMVIKLLMNKKEQYEDYNLDQFMMEAKQFFEIKDRKPLKGGKREIFFLIPG